MLFCRYLGNSRGYEYSGSIWLWVSPFGFETLTLFRTNAQFYFPDQAKDKMHALLFESHLLGISIE